jgi:hypothetical protein
MNDRSNQRINFNVRRRSNGSKWIPGFWRSGLLLSIVLALGASTVLCCAGEGVPSEAQLKAAFLFNFLKYVEWPATAFSSTNSPIVIAILGDDTVADEFSAMNQRKVIEGHLVQLVRVTTVEQSRDCQILFIGSQESRRLADMLPKLRGLNILTVGESDQFIDQGGMINLARRDRRVLLEVNMDAIRQTELKISSKLLALAAVKGGKK